MPTQKAATKLEAIATDMYAAVLAGQAWHHRPLPNGLELVLQRKERQWRLALGRDGVVPSDVEVDIVRAAFAVPAAAEPARAQRPRQMPKTGRLATYHIVELYWVEQETAVAV